MINYGNGKIYKIEPINGEDGDVYIGSTTKQYLSQRMTAHRTNYKCFLNGKGANVTSFKLFDKYGIDNCHILLLESVNAHSKDELHAREAHYIKTISCVNKVIPLQTKKEYSEVNKDKIKEWREANRDALLIKKKEYRNANKDKMKEYREANRDALLIQMKEYREANKDKMKEYREANKDKKREYRAANKDKIKEYYEANKDAINEKRRELRKAKKQQDITV